MDGEYEVFLVAGDMKMDEAVLQSIGVVSLRFSTPLELTV